jgi:hypothetical protein
MKITRDTVGGHTSFKAHAGIDVRLTGLDAVNATARTRECKLGAKPQDEWTGYRLTRTEIEQLAER